MALFARTRPGTSASFWRNHDTLQDMMLAACTTPTRRPLPGSAAPSKPVPVTLAAPVWIPTPEQWARY